MENLTRRKFVQATAMAVAANSAAIAADSATLQGELYTGVYPLNGTDWLLNIDPSNQGRQQGWATKPTGDAKPTKVPWVIQDTFPDYHGVAWYWRDFNAPPNPHHDGRYLLRFQAVDYLGEVWVNGIRIGVHEGGEEPFVLDITDAIKVDEPNLLAVRVLSPTHELIDGIRLEEVAEGRRDYPTPKDNSYSTGGITSSVELLVSPLVRVENLRSFQIGRPEKFVFSPTFTMRARMPCPAHVTFVGLPGARGKHCGIEGLAPDFKPGDTRIEDAITVPSFHLWELNDPFLYRVAARVQAAEQRFDRRVFGALRFPRLPV